MVDRVSDGCAVAAAAMLAAAMLIVVWMVAYRAMGNSDLLGDRGRDVPHRGHGPRRLARTASRPAATSASTCSPSGCPRAASPSSRASLPCLGLAVCLYLAWEGLLLTLEAWHKNEHSGSSWNPPRWPFFALMPVGLGLTALQYVAEMLRAEPEADGGAGGTISGQGA